MHHPLAAGTARTGIDGVLPRFDVREYHELAVPAAPGEVDLALRRIDLLSSPTIRLLFAARGIRDLAGRRTMTLEDLRRLLGFAVIVDEPGKELLFASRDGERRGPLARVDLAWSFRIEPAAGGGSVLSTETRAHAQDEGARRAFLRYWTVVGPFSALIRRRLLDLVRTATAANTA